MSDVLDHGRSVAAVPSRDDLHAFYDAYFEALDEARIADWPAFFADECSYQVIPRENYEAGYPLCTMRADSRGMLVDRAQAILKAQMFAPRYLRRFYSGLRLVPNAGGMLTVRQNIMAIQTLVDGAPQILACGVAHDSVAVLEAGLRFRERIVVLDSEMIHNSLIFPL